MKRSDIPLPFYIEKYPIYVRFLPSPPLGISDFDSQVSGIQFWKADENLRSVEKKMTILRNIGWWLAFCTF
jgi:hypothetical protein